MFIRVIIYRFIVYKSLFMVFVYRFIVYGVCDNKIGTCFCNHTITLSIDGRLVSQENYVVIIDI